MVCGVQTCEIGYWIKSQSSLLAFAIQNVGNLHINRTKGTDLNMEAIYIPYMLRRSYNFLLVNISDISCRPTMRMFANRS